MFLCPLAQLTQFVGTTHLILDAPLLIESGLYRVCHETIIVHASREKQLERLLRRNPSLTKEEATKRIDAQMPTQEKLKRVPNATLINNDGSESELADAVDTLAPRLRALSTNFTLRNLIIVLTAVVALLVALLYYRFN